MPHHITTGQLTSGYKMPADTKIVILNIADGQENKRSTIGSGQAMVTALRHQLMSHGIAVMTSRSQDLADGFTEAERLGFTHVAKGMFTRWEDNATAWSGNPDRAAFSIEIYEAKSKLLIASSEHQVQASGLAVTSNSPTRFIRELAERTLGRIFGWEVKK